MKTNVIVFVVLSFSGCFVDPVPVESGTDGSSSGSSSAGGSAAVTTNVDTSGFGMSSDTAASTASVSSSEDEGSGDTTSSTSDGDSSTGDSDSSAYAGCSQTDQSACTPLNPTCIWTDGIAEAIAPSGFCAQPCTEPADCPPAPDGSDAIVNCTYYGLDLHCVLLCGDQHGDPPPMCPPSMTCLEQMVLPEVAGTYMGVCVAAP